jgi:hypothetical protein
LNRLGFHTGLRAAIDRAVAAEDLASRRDGETVLAGELRARDGRDVCGVSWPTKFFVLTRAGLYRAASASASEAEKVYLVSPSAAVFGTDLRAFAFELVTTRGVAHVAAATAGERDLWVDALRATAAAADPLPSEADPLAVGPGPPLERASLACSTRGAAPPLERRGEWALAAQDSKLAGAALAAINGASCLLCGYEEIRRRLDAWRTPLDLEFLLPPERTGRLVLRDTAPSRAVWNPNRFKIPST